MRPENRLGTPVDPVPFLVVTAAGFLGCYSSGPIYLMEFGLDLPGALALTTVVFLGVAAAAYHRFVWAARPDLRGEVPAGLRFRRLVLAGLVLGAVFVLLSLPFYGP